MTREASTLLAEAEYYRRSGDVALCRETCSRVVAEHGDGEEVTRAREILIELEAELSDGLARGGARARRHRAVSKELNGGHRLTLFAQGVLLAVCGWDVLTIFARTQSLDACATELLLAAVFAIMLLGTWSVRAPGPPPVSRRLAAALAAAGYGAFAAAVVCGSEGLVESLAQRPAEAGIIAVLLMGGVTWLARSTWNQVDGWAIFDVPRWLALATVAVSLGAALAASWLHPWCVRTFVAPSNGDLAHLFEAAASAQRLRENATAVATLVWLPLGLIGLVRGAAPRR